MGSVTRIGVVAASSRFSKATAARLEAHVEARFPGGDVKVVFHPACFANHGHFAGDDALRARAFLEMANDPRYDAVWFARGGYGSCRIAEAVRDGLKIVMDGDGLALSKRRITLSTSGVVPMMARAGAEIGVNLAVSLHAVTKDVRDELVPLNKKYGIEELLQACADYPGANNARRITFEYVMLKYKNDSDADAHELVRLLRHYDLPAKVNLIPFNPWPGADYECSTPERIRRFSDIVFEGGISAPVRTPRGRDIDAACGQLKTAAEKKSRAQLDRESEEKFAALG